MILLDALVGVDKDLLILSHGQLLVLVLEDVQRVEMGTGDVLGVSERERPEARMR